MTVLQFRPRQQTPAEPAPMKSFPSPMRFAKAWLCVAIGLSLSPWIRWLELLSEQDETVTDHRKR